MLYIIICFLNKYLWSICDKPNTLRGPGVTMINTTEILSSGGLLSTTGRETFITQGVNAVTREYVGCYGNPPADEKRTRK